MLYRDKSYTRGWRPQQETVGDRLGIGVLLRHNCQWCDKSRNQGTAKSEAGIDKTYRYMYVGSLREMHCWLRVTMSMEIKRSTLTHHAKCTLTGLGLPRCPHPTSPKAEDTGGRSTLGPLYPLIHFPRSAKHSKAEIGPLFFCRFLSNPLKNLGKAAVISETPTARICHCHF